MTIKKNMRLKNLILCLLICIVSASAKDVITKTDGTKLDAKVERITDTFVEYRKASNLTGPIYTISIESVYNITYENGEVENFNTVPAIQQYATGDSYTPSDDDLIRMSGAQEVSSLLGGVSDAQLIRMVNSYSAEEHLIKKAKKYRIIGWTGGGVLFAIGTIAGILEDHQNQFNSDENPNALLTGVGVGCVLGGAWCLGFNLKSNSLIKKARQIQSYSSTIIENEILQFGDNSLTAGINVMGNRMVNSHSLGLSLGLNF